MICGSDGPKTVTNMNDAIECYGKMISDLPVYWAHDPAWKRHISGNSCNTMLFGATDDPTDEYCTYHTTGTDDPTSYKHFATVPRCENIEQATISFLDATTGVKPGMKKFMYAHDPLSCDYYEKEDDGSLATFNGIDERLNRVYISDPGTAFATAIPSASSVLRPVTVVEETHTHETGDALAISNVVIGSSTLIVLIVTIIVQAVSGRRRSRRIAYDETPMVELHGNMRGRRRF